MAPSTNVIILAIVTAALASAVPTAHIEATMQQPNAEPIQARDPVAESLPEVKAQPWRAVWPAPRAANTENYERLQSGGGTGGRRSFEGRYGFNDAGEGIAAEN